MAEWSYLTVDEIAERVAMGPFGSSIKVETFTDSGVPVISGQHLHGHRLEEDSGYKFVAPSHADRLARSNVRRGDVVLTHAGTIGQAAYISEDSKFDRYIISQRQFYVRCNRSRMLPEFLVYYLHSPAGRHDLLANSSYSGVPSLAQPSSYVKTLRVPVPVLAEQRAIADVLGALDDKIAANTKLATTADELAAALVRSAVDPAGSVTLAETARITMGSSPPGETFNEHGEGAPFFQGVRDFGHRFPSRRVWTTGPTRWAEEGDLLVSVRAPVGKVNVAPERLCVGRGLAAVRARDGRQATLYHLLQHVPDVWLPFEAEGTVFGSINRAQLHALELPVVNPDLVGETEARLSALEGRIRSSVVENVRLSATRDALLPALMSGRLRVEEAVEVAGL